MNALLVRHFVYICSAVWLLFYKMSFICWIFWTSGFSSEKTILSVVSPCRWSSSGRIQLTCSDLLLICKSCRQSAALFLRCGCVRFLPFPAYIHEDAFLSCDLVCCTREKFFTPTSSGWSREILTDFWVLIKAEREKLVCTGKSFGSDSVLPVPVFFLWGFRNKSQRRESSSRGNSRGPVILYRRKYIWK